MSNLSQGFRAFRLKKMDPKNINNVDFLQIKKINLQREISHLIRCSLRITSRNKDSNKETSIKGL